MKRIFFSVGEPSGDLHGSNLIRQLKTVDPTIECVGFGGPKMEAAGLDQHYDLTQHAVMMLSEILKKLRFFFSLVDKAEEYFEANKVDAVVLIDYPGFNWHIAKRAKKLGIPVFYYGVPQMWAWAPWRIRKARRLIDHVLCKLPFEKSGLSSEAARQRMLGTPFLTSLPLRNTTSSSWRTFPIQVMSPPALLCRRKASMPNTTRNKRKNDNSRRNYCCCFQAPVAKRCETICL